MCAVYSYFNHFFLFIKTDDDDDDDDVLRVFELFPHTHTWALSPSLGWACVGGRT